MVNTRHASEEIVQSKENSELMGLKVSEKGFVNS